MTREDQLGDLVRAVYNIWASSRKCGGAMLHRHSSKCWDWDKIAWRCGAAVRADKNGSVWR